MNDLDNLRSMAGALLVEQRLPTADVIRQAVQKARVACPDVTDDDCEQVAREFEEAHCITMNIGEVLREADFEPWLSVAKEDAGLDFYYWNRYRRYLGRKGLSARVLWAMHDVTDLTLDLLQNPNKEGRWSRRGMVVGHVQSGKTANYIGLICKAADVGYKVIVVIAGIHNNLRNQTQKRLDEGFTGFDSAQIQGAGGANKRIGVGLDGLKRRPATFTTSLRDFNLMTATGVGLPLVNLREPALFVIKKNSRTLHNLLEWLKNHNADPQTSSIDTPMLLIDDEADNASINIARGMDEVSRINGQIRQLLEIFSKNCYVGYTATPFANIFIDPRSDDEMHGEDLFPRDFIVSLDPPDNYFGALTVFNGAFDEDRQRPENRHVRQLEDNHDLLPIVHRKEQVVQSLPRSLKDAVRTFIIARSIRLTRGHKREHNSMLVNVSRFVDVQRQIRNEIHAFLSDVQSSIRVNGAKQKTEALSDIQIAALHDVFLREYYALDKSLSWRDIQNRLFEAVGPIQVVEVNGKSQARLDYSNHQSGLNVIAVGGFSLSRGLTLEGLVVSYFLRNSMMYDTLMQMGRWFGYRSGYQDLCRIWMPEQAAGWYTHIAESIEELRDELRQMRIVGATPKEFGLKVRSHPDSLVVTARNKMGSGQSIVVSIGLANQFVETTTLLREAGQRNRNAAARLATLLAADGRALDSAKHTGSGYLTRDVPVRHVLTFLRGFKNAPSSRLTETHQIVKHITDRADGELKSWSIFVPAPQKRFDHEPLRTSLLGFEISCQRRREGEVQDPSEIRITNNQRVASRGVEQVDVEEDLKSNAERDYRERRRISGEGRDINYPDSIYRGVRRRPLLVLHLIAIGQKGQNLSGQQPVVAWSISFPKTELEDRRVEYVVNTTWFQERYRNREEEEDVGGED